MWNVPEILAHVPGCTPPGRLRPARQCAVTLLLWFGVLLLAGCASPPGPAAGRQPFAFGQDTFAFANELAWDYGYDAEGIWYAKTREPKPEYTLHCFVLARSALQFYHHAEFSPHLTPTNDIAYRKAIRRVVKRNPRRAPQPGGQVVIPGYTNLFDFSYAHPTLLQRNCGGAWQSYFQRGHWRMILPFFRKQQAATANRLLRWVKEDRPVVIHVVRFPKITINHALLVYEGVRTPCGAEFSVYDPNNAKQPKRLRYDSKSRTFSLPRNDYFEGGRVDVYPVFHQWAY